MNKKVLILLMGIFFLLFGVFILIFSDNKQSPKIQESFSEKNARSIILDKLQTILNIYENPSKVFSVKESDNKLYFEISNYELIDKEVSLNYKKLLENVSINNNKLFIINDNKVLILKPIEDIKYVIDNVNVDILSFNDKEIIANLSFSNYKLNEKDELEYKVVKKNIKLLKVSNLWLIDEFNY